MLVATWIITFVLIIGVGIYAGTKITSSSQWSGGDKTMGAFAIGAVLGAWQIGGMSLVGAAPEDYNLYHGYCGLLVFHCRRRLFPVGGGFVQGTS